MKNKLQVIVVLMIVITMLTGCNTDQLKYFNEVEKVNSWEAFDTKMSGTIGFDIDNIAKGELVFDADGKYDVNDTAMQMDMDMSIKASDNLWKYSELSGSFVYPHISMYFDGDKIYLNKEYALGMMELLSLTPEELEGMDKDYVAIDLNSENEFATMYKDLLSMDKDKIQSLNAGIKTLFEDYNSGIKITKSGSGYIIKMDSDTMIDEIMNLSKYAEENKDKFKAFITLIYGEDFANKYMDAENLPKATEDSTVALIGGADGPTSIFVAGDSEVSDAQDTVQVIKEMLKGSTVTVRETFGSKVYKQDIEMNLVIKDKGTATIKTSVVQTKVNSNKITMPKSTLDLTVDEVIDMFDFPSYLEDESVMTSTLDFDMQEIYGPGNGYDPIAFESYTKDDTTYVPFRKLMDSLGLEVGYNKANKEIYYINPEGEQVVCKLTVVNGVSYISAVELNEMGFETVIDDGEEYGYGIYWYVTYQK